MGRVREKIRNPSRAEQRGAVWCEPERRKAAGRLSPDESDKVVRFSRLLRHATAVFGDAERARAWLKHPQVGLGGAVPLDYASTETGAREVENLLGRIEYSVYT